MSEPLNFIAFVIVLIIIILFGFWIKLIFI